MIRNILFCYSRLPSFTNAVRDYVLAFGQFSQNQVHYFDMDSGPLDFDLTPFDCIIFNYCFWGRCLSVTPNLRQRISQFPGLKMAIFQDEYDYFLWHEHTVIDLGINTIVTCVPPAYWRDVFRGSAFDKVDFIHALTGYVPENLERISSLRPMASRKWMLGYRGRPVPFTYGRLTQEKLLIGERMKRLCQERGVVANIEVSEEARIYGREWPAFIADCRAVLGTESGSNVFDFDRTVKADIDAYLKDYPDADFETVHARFLKEHDGKIQMNQISPRIFEAIAMRTGLVLFEGEYSNVIQPWVHYIPLQKDFGNVEEVFAALADIQKLEAMTQRAHEEVIASGKYHFRKFIQSIDAHISKKVPIGKGYESCYGLIGWRVVADAPVAGFRNQNWCLPTAEPMRHFDTIPDPFLVIQFNWGVLHRALMRRYSTILYSGFGQKAKKLLQGNQLLYSVLRRCVRLLTGRR